MGITPKDFAKAMLLTLGYPVTDNNLKALVVWMALEGGHYHNGAKFNPLNTTQQMPGSYNPGFSAGVQAYLNWQQGLDATIKTIKYSPYAEIRSALQQSLDPDTTLRIIDKTPWGTKNYKGGWESYVSYGSKADPIGGELAILATPSASSPGATGKSLFEYVVGGTVVGGIFYYIWKKWF